MDEDLAYDAASDFVRSTGRRVLMRRQGKAWRARLLHGEREEIVVLAPTPSEAMFEMMRYLLCMIPNA